MADNPCNLRSTPFIALINPRPHFRLAIVCLAAASVGLSMAIISIAKLLLFLTALFVLLASWRESSTGTRLSALYTSRLVLAILGIFAISLFWAIAPLEEALGAFAKYGKLLTILLVVALIRTRREAFYALGAFETAQLLLALSSWLLFVGIPIPWATSNMARSYHAVFSSYLDQGIISAAAAAVLWHLRTLIATKREQIFLALAALVAVSSVLFVLPGRSGHVVAIVMLSLAIMWELPKRYRPVVVMLPFAIGAVLFAGSTTVRDRLTLMAKEVQTYSAADTASSSSALRLSYWRSATEIISANPLMGTGVGGAVTEYRKLAQVRGRASTDAEFIGNPHQEYLLWGIQLGFPGIALLLALIAVMYIDSSRFSAPYQRALQSLLAAMALACLFNSSLYDALIGDFFCVALGLLLAAGVIDSLGDSSISPETRPA
jgi:O-antigen ligase